MLHESTIYTITDERAKLISTVLSMSNFKEHLTDFSKLFYLCDLDRSHEGSTNQLGALPDILKIRQEPAEKDDII